MTKYMAFLSKIRRNEKVIRATIDDKESSQFEIEFQREILSTFKGNGKVTEYFFSRVNFMDKEPARRS